MEKIKALFDDKEEILWSESPDEELIKEVLEKRKKKEKDYLIAFLFVYAFIIFEFILSGPWSFDYLSMFRLITFGIIFPLVGVFTIYVTRLKSTSFSEYYELKDAIYVLTSKKLYIYSPLMDISGGYSTYITRFFHLDRQYFKIKDRIAYANLENMTAFLISPNHLHKITKNISFRFPEDKPSNYFHSDLWFLKDVKKLVAILVDKFSFQRVKGKKERYDRKKG